MVQLPVDEVTINDIVEWNRLKDELAKVKAKEMLLRQKIFKGWFIEAQNAEGTFYHPMQGDFKMKAVAKLDRQIEKASLEVLRETFKENSISVDSLVEYKPNLVLKSYRTLTDEQRALFDQCLIIKPGAPTLEIVAPKEK